MIGGHTAGLSLRLVLVLILYSLPLLNHPTDPALDVDKEMGVAPRSTKDLAQNNRLNVHDLLTDRCSFVRLK